MIRSKRKKRIQKRSIHPSIHPSLPFERGTSSSRLIAIESFARDWNTRFQLPARRSSSTFVNHRGYWDKRFLSAGMNRAHIAERTGLLVNRAGRRVSCGIAGNEGRRHFIASTSFFFSSSSPFFAERPPSPVSIIHRSLYQNLRPSPPIRAKIGRDNQPTAVWYALLTGAKAHGRDDRSPRFGYGGC